MLSGEGGRIKGILFGLMPKQLADVCKLLCPQWSTFMVFAVRQVH